MDRVIMISQAKKIECDYTQVLLFSFRKLSRYSGPKSTKKIQFPPSKSAKAVETVVKQAGLKYSKS